MTYDLAPIKDILNGYFADQLGEGAVDDIAEEILIALRLPEQTDRESLFKLLVDKCPFVDNCKRFCTPADQEVCWGEHTEAIFSLLTPKQTPELTLDRKLPNSSLLSLAICYEMGKAQAEHGNIWGNYPDNYNVVMNQVGERIREWLVNPPNGRYELA